MSPRVAEMPQRISEPSTPMLPRVNPSDPIRKPGLHSAITNPSYQRSVLRSWRSSMTASAIVTPRAGPQAHEQGHKPSSCDELLIPSDNDANCPRGRKVMQAQRIRLRVRRFGGAAALEPVEL